MDLVQHHQAKACERNVHRRISRFSKNFQDRIISDVSDFKTNRGTVLVFCPLSRSVDSERGDDELVASRWVTWSKCQSRLFQRKKDDPSRFLCMENTLHVYLFIPNNSVYVIYAVEFVWHSRHSFRVAIGSFPVGIPK